MDEMKEFVLWLIQVFPNVLLEPPISAFVGMALLFFCVKVIHRMMSVQEGGVWTTTPTVTVSTLLTAAGDIVTSALGWVSDTATTMSTTPIILVFVMVAFVGLGVGLIRRMMRL